LNNESGEINDPESRIGDAERLLPPEVIQPHGTRTRPLNSNPMSHFVTRELMETEAHMYMNALTNATRQRRRRRRRRKNNLPAGSKKRRRRRRRGKKKQKQRRKVDDDVLDEEYDVNQDPPS